jgi:ferrous iron transport protein A
MTKEPIPLTALSKNKQGKIIKLTGGMGFNRKLRTMGLREGEIIKIVSRQPFRGPITIEFNGSHLTLGRGMAFKIFVEEI